MKFFRNKRTKSKAFRRERKIKLNKIKFNIRNNIASPILRERLNQNKTKSKITKKSRKTIVTSPEGRNRIFSFSQGNTGGLTKKMKLKTMVRG